MATPGEIAEVRDKTNELTQDPYTDEEISAKVDLLGVELAIADVWRAKAARYADLVNTSEAGASRALSDLSKNALAQAEHWEDVGGADEPAAPPARVHVIRRTS